MKKHKNSWNKGINGDAQQTTNKHDKATKTAAKAASRTKKQIPWDT
jgi:hypothetical protein